MELRWDGVRSPGGRHGDAPAAGRRSRRAPQWVRVVGGFTEHQFAERRLPTLDEINAAAPDTPVFILHLYDRALLNRAALRAVGYTKDTPDPPGGEIQRDAHGNPTGLLLAKPNADILYATLAKGPKLPPEYQLNSTRHFMRELNRLGVTGVIDAGGGFQNYPEDYQIIEQLHRRRRADRAHRLQPVHPEAQGRSCNDFAALGDAGRARARATTLYRHNGAGEMLVYSAADFEDFRRAAARHAAAAWKASSSRWSRPAGARTAGRCACTPPTTRPSTARSTCSRRSTATCRSTGLHWFFDHCRDHLRAQSSTASRRSAAASRCSTAWPTRASTSSSATARRRPRRRRRSSACWRRACRSGAGTDATRVATLQPVGVAVLAGHRPAPSAACSSTRSATALDRETALRMWTEHVTWFSNEDGKKGRIEAGQLADLVVPDRRLLRVPRDRDRRHHARCSRWSAARWSTAPATSPLAHDACRPAMPDWSPVRRFGGYAGWARPRARRCRHAAPGGRGLRLRQRLQRARPPPRRPPGAASVPVADLEELLGRARLRLLGGLMQALRWTHVSPALRWIGAACCCARAYLQGGLHTRRLDFASAIAEMNHFGLRAGGAAGRAVIVFELGASLMILDRLPSLAGRPGAWPASR